MKKVEKDKVIKDIDDFIVGDYVAAGWKIVENSKKSSIGKTEEYK